MRINRHTDLALRVLLHLACRASADASAARETTDGIASTHGLSLHHLQKVVRALKDHGYVHLVRGPGGGVELARDPAAVTVGAVVRALDDASALVECFRPEEDACLLTPACGLKGTLHRAQEAFYAELDGTTLADLAGGRRGARLRRITGAG